jgi:hypothetical protein
MASADSSSCTPPLDLKGARSLCSVCYHCCSFKIQRLRTKIRCYLALTVEWSSWIITW